MCGTAEDLDGKSGLDAARALLEISDVLLLRFADAAKRSPKANTHPSLWHLAGSFDMRVFQRELRRHDCKLRVAIEAFQALRRKVVFGIPITDFPSASHMEHARVETRDAADTALFRDDGLPKPIDTSPNPRDRPDTGNNCASPVRVPRSFWHRRGHAVTLSVFSSK